MEVDCFKKIFRGGAVVAQSPVKRLVVGSNPTRGAKQTLTGVFVLLHGNKQMILLVFGFEQRSHVFQSLFFLPLIGIPPML